MNVPNKGDIFFSKNLSAWVVFDTDDYGGYFYDPADEHGIAHPAEAVGELEPPARDCHYRAALNTAESLTKALDAAWTKFRALANEHGGVLEGHGHLEQYVDGFQDALGYISREVERLRNGK